MKQASRSPAPIKQNNSFAWLTKENRLHVRGVVRT